MCSGSAQVNTCIPEYARGHAMCRRRYTRAKNGKGLCAGKGCGMHGVSVEVQESVQCAEWYAEMVVEYVCSGAMHRIQYTKW